MANLVKAEFKTAYLQREVVMDSILANSTQAISTDGLIPANAYKVGEVVTYNSSTNTFSPRATIASVVVGDYIIAQSDQTMEYGHVPVENRDYRYSSAIVASPAVTKKLALFKITNLDDVKLTLVTAH